MRIKDKDRELFERFFDALEERNRPKVTYANKSNGKFASSLLRRVEKAFVAEMTGGSPDRAAVLLEVLRQHKDSAPGVTYLPTHFDGKSKPNQEIRTMKSSYLYNKINYMERHQDRLYPDPLLTALKIERACRAAGV